MLSVIFVSAIMLSVTTNKNIVLSAIMLSTTNNNIVLSVITLSVILVSLCCLSFC
jgi:hypothetical protein